MKQQKLTGLLYLENQLAPHVFTAAHVAVLTAIAPQAAVSIENARLYAEVYRARNRLRQTIDSIPVLAWSASRDGSPSFFNRRWTEYTGLSLEAVTELVSCPISNDASASLLMGCDTTPAERREQSGTAQNCASLRPKRPLHPWRSRFGRSDCYLWDTELGWERVVHPDDLAAVSVAVTAWAREAPFEFEARLPRADGAYRWFLIRGEPLLDDRGNVVEWFGPSIDIEERKRAEADGEWRVCFSEVSATLTSAPIEQLDEAIDAAIERIGALFEVDRIVIFGLLNDGHGDFRPHTWMRPDLPSFEEPASFSRAMAMLRRGPEYRVGCGPESVDHDLRAELHEVGTHALASGKTPGAPALTL